MLSKNKGTKPAGSPRPGDDSPHTEQSMGAQSDAHANPEQRMHDLLNRLSHTSTDDAHFVDQDGGKTEEEPSADGGGRPSH